MPRFGGSDANVIAALKGKSKGEGKGTYGKSNYKGYGKSSGKYNGYRSPGKAIGKGSFNLYGADNDYWSAWGTEPEQWGEPEQEDWNGYYIGNVTMMLEREDKVQDDWTFVDGRKRGQVQATTQDTGIGDKECGPRLCNKFSMLCTEDDAEDVDEDLSGIEDTGAEGEVNMKRRAKNNKRQRQRKNEFRRDNYKESIGCMEHTTCDDTDEEASRDAVAREDILAKDWNGLSTAITDDDCDNHNHTNDDTTRRPTHNNKHHTTPQCTHMHNGTQTNTILYQY